MMPLERREVRLAVPAGLRVPDRMTENCQEVKMCLGVPGRVVEMWDLQGIPMGRVDFGGVYKEVCLAYVPDIQIGQYAIVHVGFAITTLDEVSALETLELIRNIGLLDAELNVGGDPGQRSAWLP